MNSADTLSFLQSGCISGAVSGKLVIAWGEPIRAAQPASAGVSCFAPDYFLRDPHPWFHFPHSKTLSAEQLQETLASVTAQIHEEPPLTWETPNVEIFRATVEALLTRIQNDELQKGVPYAFERAQLNTSQTSISFRHRLLSRALPAVTGTRLQLYGLWHKTEGLLGATPEILFQWDENRVLHSAAIAGTLAKVPGATREDEAVRLEAFLKDPKERWEHELVIRGIRQALETFGQLQVGPTSVLDLPALYHLYTPIELPLPHDRNFDDVVQVLHPTPALGAWPRSAGGVWLRELEEKMPRGRYGAPFGIVNESGQARCWVAIRNIQWNANQLRIGAGCGVVASSNWQKEWGELQAKLRSIHQVFGL